MRKKQGSKWIILVLSLAMLAVFAPALPAGAIVQDGGEDNGGAAIDCQGLVPQIKWAGENVVLQKDFGVPLQPVVFTRTLGPGGFTQENSISNQVERDTLVTITDLTGVARAMYFSPVKGKVDILAELRQWPAGLPDLARTEAKAQELFEANQLGSVLDQHLFAVFYLELVDITLGNTRIDPGDDPADTSNDVVSHTVFVTDDQVLRAKVRGHFVDHQGNNWILPDQWADLAGENWQQSRPCWDTHDDSNDLIKSGPRDIFDPPADELGPYFDYSVTPPEKVAEAPVIGPFSLLDLGWPAPDFSPLLTWQTIIRNGVLNKNDAPMPPAPVKFKILDGDDADTTIDIHEPGSFFKTDKGDIYRTTDVIGFDPATGLPITATRYTAPFYKMLIPDLPLIPVTLNTGGYLWDSWGKTGGALPDGPYDFWDIVFEAVFPPDSEGPKEVKVYTDEHGEAMVSLTSGDTFDLHPFQNSLGAKEESLDRCDPTTEWCGFDIPFGSVVGATKVRAFADYPAHRGQLLDKLSNVVTKSWKSQWKKELTVEGFPGLPDKKEVTAHLQDIHGNPIRGERVHWYIEGPGEIILVNGRARNCSETYPTDCIAGDGERAISISSCCGVTDIVVNNMTVVGVTLVKAFFPDELIERVTEIRWNTAVGGGTDTGGGGTTTTTTAGGTTDTGGSGSGSGSGGTTTTTTAGGGGSGSGTTTTTTASGGGGGGTTSVQSASIPAATAAAPAAAAAVASAAPAAASAVASAAPAAAAAAGTVAKAAPKLAKPVTKVVKLAISKVKALPVWNKVKSLVRGAKKGKAASSATSVKLVNKGVLFSYHLNKPAAVTIHIFKNKRLVRTVTKNTYGSAGANSVLWTGTNAKGKLLPAGSYGYVMLASAGKETTKATGTVILGATASTAKKATAKVKTTKTSGGR